MKLWHQAMAEVDYLARKLASAACCDEENLVQEKKEQYREVPLMIEKQDQVGVSLSKQGAELKQGSHPDVLQDEGPEVADMKAGAGIKMDKMQSGQGEALQLKKKAQELEEKLSKEEMDLEADKLLATEWIESKSKENFAEAAEEPDFKKLMLRQVNLNTKEVENSPQNIV